MSIGSFAPLLRQLNNAAFRTSSPADGPKPIRIGNEDLIPFYIHAPDSLPESAAIRLSPLPRRTSSRRTSSSAAQQRPIKPLASYLTRPDSSEDLQSLISKQQDELQNDPAGYSSADQARDFSSPIGYLRPAIVEAMLIDNEKMINIHSRPCWKVIYPIKPSEASLDDQNSSALETAEPIVTGEPCCLAFEDWINHEEGRRSVRKEHFDRLVRGWKESGQFLTLLNGWRDEEYAIYGPKQPVSDLQKPQNPSNLPSDLSQEEEDDPDGVETLPGSHIAFRMERAATGLFGFLTFGAHLTAYVMKHGEYYFWVPRRSPNKQTWPSMLDNTAAGGITAGESATETIIRECYEEASLPEEIVLPRLKATGLISYVHRNADGWVQPEVQYVYDLELPSDVIPMTNDGEATDFQLMSFEETRSTLLNKSSNQWKPNCAGVMIDFFIRHGLITPENEPHYLQVCTELKQSHGLPGP